MALAMLVGLVGAAQSSDQMAAEIGPDFQISTMGGGGQEDIWGQRVSSDTGALGSSNLEIWSQRLDPYGNEIGTNDFRVSHMGPDTGTNPDPSLWAADEPDVAYSPVSGEYLAVWTGWHPSQTGSTPTREIFGQRLMPYKLKTFVADR